MSVPELYQNGVLKELLQKGIITPTVYRSIEIFMEVKSLELSGMIKSHAVVEVAMKIKGKSQQDSKEKAVWRALKLIEGPKKRI